MDQYQQTHPALRVTTSRQRIERKLAHAKNLSENYLLFGHAPSKRFTSPVLCRKKNLNIGCKGCQVISVPEAPKFVRQVPHKYNIIHVFK